MWPIINENDPNIYLILISIIFLILGLLNAKILSPLNLIWIKFGELLGKIIAPIVMAIIYFIILTPISLIVRLFGKDLLGLNSQNKSKHTGLIEKKFGFNEKTILVKNNFLEFFYNNYFNTNFRNIYSEFLI